MVGPQFPSAGFLPNHPNERLKRPSVPYSRSVARSIIQDELAFVGPFGWSDYSDESIGTVLQIPADTQVQVNRPLSPAAVNNQLSGVFKDHDFWQGTAIDMRIIPRAAGDVMMISVFAAIMPNIRGGTVSVDIDVGGAIGSIGRQSYSFVKDAGDVEDFRFPSFIIPVRNAFFNNGGRVYLRSDVPCELTEFSPEFYPLSIVST